MNATPARWSLSDRSLALLADHDHDTLQRYAAFLRAAAYDIEEAADGREALAKALSRHPHVIVADARLPGIDGFRLCELLRNDYSTQAIPIIVVTAEANGADLPGAARARADAVLTKPCLPERLLAEIQGLTKSRELLKRSDAARSEGQAQLVRPDMWLEKSDQIRVRIPLSRAFNRHNTTAPPAQPPALVCPACDRPLLYQHSHIGGVSERHREQWDYYECAVGCGTFQYRQRTHRLRKLTG